MKRVLIRLSALTGIIVLGLIAIAQAERGSEPAPAAAKAPAQPKAAPKPIPLVADTRDGNLAAKDPFARPSGGGNALSAKNLATDALPPARVRLRAATDDIPQAGDVLGGEAAVASQPPARRASREPQRLAPQDNRYDRARRLASDLQDRYPVRPVAAEAPAAAPLDPELPDAAPGEPRPLKAQVKAGAGTAAQDARDNFAPPAKGDRYGSRGGAQEPPDQPEELDAPAPLRSVSPFGSAPPLNSASNFAVPRQTESPNASEGTGKPGPPQLEGPQAPSLSIEKTGPKEIQVGKPATFITKVRNVGQVAAQDVEVRDEVPKGTQLVSTSPNAKSGAQGELVWELGALKPGDEAKVEMQLTPLAEGEVGSVATVHFNSQASVRSVVTRPQLEVAVKGPEKVMIGDDVMLKIKITNSGSGAAGGVILTDILPPGLKHPSGGELEFEVGTLKPGESRDLELNLKAAQAGRMTNVLAARGEGNLKVEERAEIEVVAPALKVSMTGPKRRYLERSAKHSISVSNPGTATAKDVELITTLPKGLKFVAADNAGQYDAATHAVYWSLEELPPQQTGSVSLTTMPIEQGEFKMHVKGQAKQGLKDERDEVVAVEGLAAIYFELVDVKDPIAINGQTTYEIRVMNQGSKSAANVRLVALLPPEMKAVSADGPVKYTIDDQRGAARVLFEPLSQLAPKADTTYTVKVQALQAGDLRLRVQLMTDEITTPITKEESTRVYEDE